MLSARREERPLITSPPAGPRGRRSAVLALAVLTALLGPASQAASPTVDRPVRHHAAATLPSVEQGVVRDHGPVSGLLITRHDDRCGHDPLVPGMLAVALGAVLLVVVAWRRSEPPPGRQGQPASIEARAPPFLQPV
jgi:hypothetical protein